jgi:DNA-binding response OmpR family regulator
VLTITADGGTTRKTAPPHTPPALDNDDAAKLRSAADVRILVLDDDPAICRLIQTALHGHGFAIDVVSEPGRMESYLKSQAYQLVLLDYVLPGLEPATVFDWIRDHQPDASIIVVTAYPTMDSALRCLRSHTYDYLTKPFQVEDLQKAVTRCLSSRGLLRLSEEALREQLGAAIRERRKALNLTLADVAKRAGVSLGYLSQIELGKNSASIETLYRIALALQIRLAELFQAVHATS